MSDWKNPTMKTSKLLFSMMISWALVSPANAERPQLQTKMGGVVVGVKGGIGDIDLGSKTVTISGGYRWSKWYAYTFDEKTKVTLDGKPARMENLKQAMLCDGNFISKKPIQFILLKGKVVKKEDAEKVFGAREGIGGAYYFSNGEIHYPVPVAGYIFEIAAKSPNPKARQR